MKTLSFQVPDEFKDQLDKEAEKDAVSVSELVRRKIGEAPIVIPEVYRYLENASESTGFTVSQVIASICTQYVAEQDANRAVWGQDSGEFSRFSREDDKPVTGEVLYQNTYNETIRTGENRLEMMLLDSEAHGQPLEPEERDFLIRRRVGKAWLESEEFKRAEAEHREIAELAKEARESGLVPKGTKIGEFSLANLWKAVKDGRWTREQFTEQISLSAKTRHGWEEK